MHAGGDRTNREAQRPVTPSGGVVLNFFLQMLAQLLFHILMDLTYLDGSDQDERSRAYAEARSRTSARW